MRGKRRPSPEAIVVSLICTLAFGVLIGRRIAANGEAGSAPSSLLARLPAQQPAANSESNNSQPAAEAQLTAAAKRPQRHRRSSSAPAETQSGQPASATEGLTASGGGAQGETTATPLPTAAEPFGGGVPQSGSGSTTGQSQLPPIKHVFLIVLFDTGEESAFSPTGPDPYLAGKLRAQGELIGNYYAVSSGSLADEVALISGQQPTAQTAETCSATASQGSAGGQPSPSQSGCPYPATVETIANQLEGAHKSWRAYIGGLEAAPQLAAALCGGAAPAAPAQPAESGFALWLDPFAFFEAVRTSPTCAQHQRGLSQLAADLRAEATTPSFSYIAPDLCEDGSQLCPAAGGGRATADQFLERVVPAIERSPAYRDGGLIAITFDHAPPTGPEADHSGCCTADSLAPAAPATAGGSPSASGEGDLGGGKVGLLLISRYVRPGSENVVGQYNHFSLLLSFEQLFGLQPLGAAATPGLLPFDQSVYKASF